LFVCFHNIQLAAGNLAKSSSKDMSSQGTVIRKCRHHIQLIDHAHFSITSLCFFLFLFLSLASGTNRTLVLSTIQFNSLCDSGTPSFYVDVRNPASRNLVKKIVLPNANYLMRSPKTIDFVLYMWDSATFPSLILDVWEDDFIGDDSLGTISPFFAMKLH